MHCLVTFCRLVKLVNHKLSCQDHRANWVRVSDPGSLGELDEINLHFIWRRVQQVSSIALLYRQFFAQTCSAEQLFSLESTSFHPGSKQLDPMCQSNFSSHLLDDLYLRTINLQQFHSVSLYKGSHRILAGISTIHEVMQLYTAHIIQTSITDGDINLNGSGMSRNEGKYEKLDNIILYFAPVCYHL